MGGGRGLKSHSHPLPQHFGIWDQHVVMQVLRSFAPGISILSATMPIMNVTGQNGGDWHLDLLQWCHTQENVYSTTLVIY